MTKEKILAMGAGRGLDALVAKEIIELEMSYLGTHHPSVMVAPGVWSPPACYSTDISAAWQVVKKMIILGFEITLNYCHTDKWSISFFDEGPEMFEGIGKEAPEAICKAALIAKYFKE